MKNTNKVKQQSRRNFIKLAAASTALLYTPILSSKTPLGTPMSPETETFFKACRDGALDTVKSMLASDPTLLTAKDDLGRSGFAIALLSGHRQVGDFLKEMGYQTDLHETALDLDWSRYDALVGEETAATESRINADHPIGGTLMWAAAAGGAGQSIWHVYANCGNPNHNPRAAAGSTPLQQALLFADLKTAEMTAATLLSNDADPNPPGNAELPPLHIAAQRGSYELVEMLIRLGANVSVRDKAGKTAAQSADYFGHKSVFELLTKHEQIPRTCTSSRAAVDLNGRPYEIPDMLDIPCYQRGNLVGSSHRNLEAVKKAVTADPRMAHSVATTNERAVEAGAHMGRKDMVEFLITNGAPYSLPTAVMLNDFTTVRRMLDEDPNRIHERGAHDFALLWYPIIGGGQLEMVQLLLERGAKVEQQHYLGTTALHFACMRDYLEIIELLIENGADVNRVGRKFSAEGDTPLQLTKDEKVANYLRSKGAK